MLFEVRRAYLDEGCVLQPGEVMVMGYDRMREAAVAVTNGFLRKLSVRETYVVFRQFCREAGASIDSAGDVLMVLRATLPVRNQWSVISNQRLVAPQRKINRIGRIGSPATALRQTQGEGASAGSARGASTDLRQAQGEGLGGRKRRKVKRGRRKGASR